MTAGCEELNQQLVACEAMSIPLSRGVVHVSQTHLSCTMNHAGQGVGFGGFDWERSCGSVPERSKRPRFRNEHANYEGCFGGFERVWECCGGFESFGPPAEYHSFSWILLCFCFLLGGGAFIGRDLTKRPLCFPSSWGLRVPKPSGLCAKTHKSCKS